MKSIVLEELLLTEEQQAVLDRCTEAYRTQNMTYTEYVNIVRRFHNLSVMNERAQEEELNRKGMEWG